MATLEQHLRACLSKMPGIIRVDAGETGVSIKRIAHSEGTEARSIDCDILALTRSYVRPSTPVSIERTLELV